MIEVLKQMVEAMLWIEPCDRTKAIEDAIQAGRQAIAELESQEPVAYLCENAVGHKYFRWKKPTSIYKPIALYTHPPQRTWQGLTDEEITKIVNANSSKGLYLMAKAIEAKLKELNG